MATTNTIIMTMTTMISGMRMHTNTSAQKAGPPRPHAVIATLFGATLFNDRGVGIQVLQLVLYMTIYTGCLDVERRRGFILALVTYIIGRLRGFYVDGGHLWVIERRYGRDTIGMYARVALDPTALVDPHLVRRIFLDGAITNCGMRLTIFVMNDLGRCLFAIFGLGDGFVATIWYFFSATITNDIFGNFPTPLDFGKGDFLGGRGGVTSVWSFLGGLPARPSTPDNGPATRKVKLTVVIAAFFGVISSSTCNSVSVAASS